MTPTIPKEFAYCVSYQDGMFLTSGNMSTEQAYFVNWLTLQNQLTMTAGVLSGLEVTNPTANTVLVATGAGLDPAGHLLVVPQGATNTTLSVQSSPNPTYVYLVYPTTTQAATGMPAYTLNMAALPQLGGMPNPPNNGIILAKISLNEAGNIVSITDMRQGVASRLPITFGVKTQDATADTVMVAPGGTCQGNVTIPTTTLTRAGASLSQPVTFIAADVPAFAAAPRVVASAQGSIPYAVSVGDVTTIGFTLTVTAVTPQADSPPLQVAWLALAP